MNQQIFPSVSDARAVFERWRLDYNNVRPHSTHRELTPEAVQLNPAASRLRNLEGSAAPPLPPALQNNCQTAGLSQ